MSIQFIKKLENQFQKPLLGQAAQNKMAHKVRMKTIPPPDDARIACILNLLYLKDKEWHIVLIKRTSKFKQDKHKGQVSFPGGKLEEFDESLAAGALREAQEEVNIDPSTVTLIAPMTALYIPVSNFLIYPFLGYSLTPPDLVPDPEEVAGIIELPLKHLLDPSNQKVIDKKITPNLTLKRLPYYDIEGEVVWGATAMILSEFVETIRAMKAEVLI